MSEFQQIGDVARRVVDRWRWWQTALADPAAIGSEKLPIHESEPQQGYYRVRNKDGAWEPVAIWFDEETALWCGYRNGSDVADINMLWVWACRQPVLFEAYERAMSGGGWADEPEKAPGIGHNVADADPLDALRIEFLGEKETAEEFMRQPVRSQADADKAAIWVKRLTAIKSKADGLHKVEKQPWLDGGRQVDDRWRDIRTDPGVVADRLRQHVRPWLDEQKRLEDERQRKAREEADRLRREADAAALAARHADVAEDDEIADARQAHIDRLQAEHAAAEREAEARKVTAGRTGARIGFRREKVGVVTDYAKAAAALVAMNHPDMIALIDTLANRAAKANMAFEGMNIETMEKIQ